MTQWSSYSLSDFLMFSPDTYFRLYEINNVSLWPLQLLMLVAAVTLLVLSRRSDRQSVYIMVIMLALIWSAVAWQFFYQLYLQVNLAASWFALAFAIEAFLLIALLPGMHKKSNHIKLMLWLYVYAVLIHPLTGLMSGRNWQGIEIFGLAPDPTALATLAILFGTTGIRARLLSLLPLTWCIISGLTYLAMEKPVGLLTPLIALLAFALSFRKPSATNFT